MFIIHRLNIEYNIVYTVRLNRNKPTDEEKKIEIKIGTSNK